MFQRMEIIFTHDILTFFLLLLENGTSGAQQASLIWKIPDFFFSFLFLWLGSHYFAYEF
jgi:hypothetical protein